MLAGGRALRALWAVGRALLRAIRTILSRRARLGALLRRVVGGGLVLVVDLVLDVDASRLVAAQFGLRLGPRLFAGVLRLGGALVLALFVLVFFNHTDLEGRGRLLAVLGLFRGLLVGFGGLGVLLGFLFIGPLAGLNFIAVDNGETEAA